MSVPWPTCLPTWHNLDNLLAQLAPTLPACCQKIGVQLEPRYDPNRDYRDYVVTDKDLPLLSTLAASNALGLHQRESVRTFIADGRLPARRGAHRNSTFQIPAWAVKGMAEFRHGPGDPDQPSRSEGSSRENRILELENALVVLRNAAEHERNARRLLEQAIAEANTANDILSNGVSSVLIPQSPPTS